jgi:hypothetical protein
MNKTEKPLAIASADWLERSWKFYGEQHMKAATELRRLHVENEALREALDLIANTGPDARQCCDIARAAIARTGEKT